MLATLLKKQLLEINRGFFYNRKTGKSRSKLSTALFIALYAFLMVFVLGGMFGGFALMLCESLIEAGVDWLYFTVFALLATLLGVFGSVFNTAAGLYAAKDNDLLLSMPIPVSYILISRLLGTYLLGLMFSAVVMLPAVAVYCIIAPFRVSALLGSLLLILLVSLLVLVLTCVLGYIVAKISAKLKNKNFITVLLTLAFLVVYYMFCFRANALIASLAEHAAALGGSVRGSAYPLYLLGRVGVGDGMAALIITAAVLVLLVLTCALLARSFLSIATASRGIAKTRYRERALKTHSVDGAMRQKEFARFFSSPNYMLNCGLGIVFMPVCGVFLLIKGADLREMLGAMLPGADFAAVALICGICMLASMNDMTAPSVSLEGKSLWLAQSLPIEPWKILRAKLSVQLWLTLPVVLFASVSAAVALRPSAAVCGFLILLPFLYSVLAALFGLFMNLKKPNLSWTNEIIPIKQSMSVMVTLFGGWGYALLTAGSCLLLGEKIGILPCLAGFGVLTLALCALLYRWLRHTGTKAFMSL